MQKPLYKAAACTDIWLFRIWGEIATFIEYITNPPFGVRTSANKDLRNLYAQFGNILRQEFKGWQIVFLCNNVMLANQTKLKPKSLLAFTNGGINVQAFYAQVE